VRGTAHDSAMAEFHWGENIQRRYAPRILYSLKPRWVRRSWTPGSGAPTSLVRRQRWRQRNAVGHANECGTAV
jgi:hypothetical protein